MIWDGGKWRYLSINFFPKITLIMILLNKLLINLFSDSRVGQHIDLILSLWHSRQSRISYLPNSAADHIRVLEFETEIKIHSDISTGVYLHLCSGFDLLLLMFCT